MRSCTSESFAKIWLVTDMISGQFACFSRMSDCNSGKVYL